MIRFLVVIALLGLGSAAAAQPVPQPGPTAREVYVSCYLVSQGTNVANSRDSPIPQYAAITCESLAIGAIANREGNTNQRYRFCLPHDYSTTADPLTAMARAYVDFFEQTTPAGRTHENGSAAFLIAMITRWPCPTPVAPPAPP